METARSWYQRDDVHLKQVSDIFLELFDVHCSTTARSYYTFSDEAHQTLTLLSDDFIQDVNSAIQNGNQVAGYSAVTPMLVFDFRQ